MDFERAALKALFYDFPIESMTKMLIEKEYSHFWNIFVGLVKWREQKFSKTESIALKNILEYKLVKNYDKHDIEKCILPGVLGLLNEFGENVLSYEHNEPCVKYEQLLRWHEISLCLGEDTFIIPYTAKKDVSHGHERKWFSWPDVLTHNNERINTLLNEGLSDVHAHLNASCDVFGINWISLMNCPDADNINKLTNYFSYNDKDKGDFMEMPILLHPDMSPIPLSRLVLLASALRVYLFQFLFGRNQNDIANFQKRIYNLVKGTDGDIPGIRQDITTEINVERMESLKTSFGYAFDYAISDLSCDIDERHTSSVYMLLYGERKLMYKFFYLFYTDMDKCMKIIPFFYLYLLIRIRFRRELVQTNALVGFENFSDYQKRKGLFVKRGNGFENMIPIYSIQSCLRPKINDTFEARIAPPNTADAGYWHKLDFKHALFNKYKDSWKDKHVELVVHFIKSNKGNSRKIYQYQINNILECRDLLKNSNIRITGIDAAGSEFKAAPEVFGHVFRYAKSKGILHVTFHAGEDFYDLIDGLRAIDETILFMEMNRGDRIGHALALGTCADAYYKGRHYKAVLPKIVLLDNLVWLYYKVKEYNLRLPGNIEYFIENKCFEIYQDLYNDKRGTSAPNDFSFFHYKNSMLLRSNGDNEKKDDKEVSYSNLWNETASCHSEKCQLAAKDNVAREIYDSYKTLNKSECCMCSFPEEIADIVAKLQECMINDIADRGIAIECNPSSNIKIGSFERYDQHPIFRFFHPDKLKEDAHRLNVSINTDDRGVFGTSLYNEYSLISLAMYKQRNEDGSRRWNDEVIEDYLKTIIKNSREQQFANYYRDEE